MIFKAGAFETSRMTVQPGSGAFWAAAKLCRVGAPRPGGDPAPERAGCAARLSCRRCRTRPVACGIAAAYDGSGPQGRGVDMADERQSEGVPAAELRMKLMAIADQIAAMRSPKDPRLDAVLEITAEVIGVLARTLDRHERSMRSPQY
jgi:hypothetical protein